MVVEGSISEDAAFRYNAMTSIVIPDNIVSIGDEAFRANYLTSVTIPASVESIGSRVFEGNGARRRSQDIPWVFSGDSQTWNLNGEVWELQ